MKKKTTLVCLSLGTVSHIVTRELFLTCKLVRGLGNITKGWDDYKKENYIDYFEQKSLVNPDHFWADDFVECTVTTCPGPGDDVEFSIVTK